MSARWGLQIIGWTFGSFLHVSLRRVVAELNYICVSNVLNVVADYDLLSQNSVCICRKTNSLKTVDSAGRRVESSECWNHGLHVAAALGWRGAVEGGRSLPAGQV